jgi:phospholipase C
MNRFALLTFSMLLLSSPFVVDAHSLQTTLTPIQHVIIIMQENHSFDNYFGTYPTANGTLVTKITSTLEPVNGIPQGICLSDGISCISPYHASGSNTVNPFEGQFVYQDDVNGGKMDGFALSSGPQSMAYFDFRQIPAYWDYAEEYGIADNYFASVLSTTTPNRLMLLSGDSVVPSNSGPPPYIPYDQTIFDQLTSNGVSWGYFDTLGAYGDPSNVFPLNYISGIDPSSLSNIQDISTFFSDLSSGTGLPEVSFVSSLGSPRFDEHPPNNVTQGEMWTVSVVNSVMQSIYWNTSVIFVTWDEGGGYYDHVPPPQRLQIDHGFSSPLNGYGQRVPLLVISPYSKENYVSETELNHLSLLLFLESNWNLLPLNSNVANSNNLLDFFDFKSAPRAPIILSSNGTYSYLSYPIPLQIPLDQLPYSRTGSSSEQSSPFDALIPNLPVAILALLVASTIFVLSIRIRRGRKGPASSRLKILLLYAR